MDELTQRILSRLREDPSSLSRNRNFFTFEEPAARRALQILRFLSGLEQDIIRRDPSGTVQVRKIERGQRLRIELVFPLLKGTRTSFLSAQEFALLLENPEVRRALGPLADEEIA